MPDMPDRAWINPEPTRNIDVALRAFSHFSDNIV